MKVVIDYTVVEGNSGRAVFYVPDISLPMDIYLDRLAIFVSTLSDFYSNLKKSKARIIKRIEE